MAFKNIVFCCTLLVISATICQCQDANRDFFCGVNNIFQHTPQGDMCGRISKTRNNRLYTSFFNLPYAEPPVGNLRLMPPVPAPSYRGIKIAYGNFQYYCVHPYKYQDTTEIRGQEDCLYCHVYTPQGRRETETRMYPTMVYFHGQAYSLANAGNNTYSPEYLLDEEICLVSCNYRVWRYGFLSMEDEIIPGNLGLKDQALALKWIQENAGEFRCDPNSVTIFGQGEGGIAAGLHVISPLSKNLFHRVISQSGSLLSYLSVKHPGVVRKKTIQFAQSVGCPTDDSYRLLDCFKRLNSTAFNSFDLVDPDPAQAIVDDGWYLTDIVQESQRTIQPFLSTNPWDSIKKPSSKPWLLVVDSKDGDEITNHAESYYYNRLLEIESNRRKEIPVLLRYNNTVTDDETKANITDAILEYYFKNTSVALSYINLTSMVGDRAQLIPAIDTVKLYNSTGNNDCNENGAVFLCIYDYINKNYHFSFSFGRLSTPFGASHGDEIISEFRYNNSIRLNDTDLDVSRKLCKLWANFATYGNPTATPIDGIPNWETASGGRNYMLIDRKGSFQLKSDLLGDAYPYGLWSKFPFPRAF